MLTGRFVISLDFELHWGIFDVKSVSEYQENLDNTRNAIMEILRLADNYNINITFATVGFLFAKNKKEINNHLPSIKPNYTKAALNPYALLKLIGDSSVDDPYHYAYDIIEKIKERPNHEISSHTFSHYYCLEDGQTMNEFENDILSANNLATVRGIKLKSIVFPRNQVNESYLRICAENNITAFRGNEDHYIYKTDPERSPFKNNFCKAIRFMDSYINVTGHHTSRLSPTIYHNTLPIVNIPSSRFLRPYNQRLKLMEGLKIKRIKNSMKHAAKNNEVFHLWWHPHNFGSHTEQNIQGLEKLFKYYQVLSEKFEFKSVTMNSLSHEIINKEYFNGFN